MPTLKDKIDSYLLRHPSSLAREMADFFGVSRKEVNSIIYANREDYKQDDAFRWYLASAPQYMDSVLMKLSNVANAREFTEDDFDNLADWKNSLAPGGNKDPEFYKFRNGDIVSYGSKSEKKLLKYLDDKKLVIRCGGQSLQISYDTEFVKGRTYVPDIVVLTKKRHIAII